MVKAIQFEKHGGPEVLRLVDVDLGMPGPGQIRIKQFAAGVNFRDIYRRTGQHVVKEFPASLGTEGAGTVVAVGPGVANFHIGQRVAAAGVPDGSFAEERVVPQQLAIALPDAISFETAAAMMIRGMTARVLLKRTYAVQRGDTILVHAAAGGVGLILCQWAKHLGATVIGTVGSSDKASIARENGCDHVILYRDVDFASEVSKLTAGRGVQAVYDSVGKDTFEGSLKCLAPLGTMAQFGESSGDPPSIAPRSLGPLGSIYLTHPSLPNYHLRREDMEASAQDLFDVVTSGAVNINIGATYELKDIAAAQIEMAARRTVGSIVLSI